MPTVDYLEMRVQQVERMLGWELDDDTRRMLKRSAAGYAGGKASGRKRRSTRKADEMAESDKIEKFYGDELLAKDDEVVGYSPSSNVANRFCGNCLRYRGSRSNPIGDCAVVAGEIAQAGICNLWKEIVPVPLIIPDFMNDAVAEVRMSTEEEPDGTDKWSAWYGFIEKAVEQQIVTGVVLEPEKEDAQEDVISKEEIEQAAYGFLRNSRIVGIQHKGQLEKGHVIESYIAPVDMKIGEQNVTKGSWVMSVKVESDIVWKAIKDGTITGFSIGGTAERVPA